MFGWILLRKRCVLWQQGVRDAEWRRMTGIRPGYSVPSSGAGAGERPSSSLTEPEQGREPGHGQCCLNTFSDGKKCQIKVERLRKMKVNSPLFKQKEYSVKSWRFDCRNSQDCVKWRQVAECPFKLEVTFYSCHISICYNMKCLCSLTSATFWIVSFIDIFGNYI